MTGMTATTTKADAPPIRLEPCDELRRADESAIPVCESCGWLEDDHARPVTAGAVVTPLPRRVTPRIERKAS
jgi:hypothetical protein